MFPDTFGWTDRRLEKSYLLQPDAYRTVIAARDSRMDGSRSYTTDQGSIDSSVINSPTDVLLPRA